MSKNTNTLKVIKRDGRIEDYNSSKITNAIIKAMMKVGKQDSFNDAFEITRNIEDVIFTNFENTIDITNIEKITENMLMMYDKDVAREYTSFRGARDASRMRSSNLVKKIKGLLTNTDVEITAENANKDSTKIYVQRDLLAGTVAKEITKDLKMIPPRVQNARYNNYLHWHDEDYSPLFDMYNCMLIDYRTMFNNNFVIGNAVVESPKSFGVACTLLSQIIQGVASSQYGGQTINRIDEGLAKYVTMSYAKIISDTINDIMALYGAMKRVSFDYSEGNTIVSINNKIRTGEYFNLFTDNYDRGIIDKISEETKNQITNAIIDRSMEKIEKCVYDGAQCLEYQINTLYSTNGQTPFLSISFGLGTSIESRLIQMALLKVRIGGIGKFHKTPVFPKLLFILCKGINYYSEDPNYDIKILAMKCASLRMYPDILNYENVCKTRKGTVVYKDEAHRVVDIEKSTGFVSPMGCRSFLHRWTNPETGVEEYDGRNNMGVISVNLVRIALEAREYSDDIPTREEYFFTKLLEVLDIAHEGLTYRAERLLNVKARVSPILYGDSTVGAYGATGFSLHPDECVGKIFTNYRASVSLGFVGLHETVLALYNQKMFKNPEMIQKGKNIMNVLKSATEDWKKNSTWAFSVYATPAENLMNKFIGPDQKKFGRVEGITDKDWYTNSTHLDVQQVATGFEKIDFEGEFSEFTPGGVTCMIDCNSLKNNPMSLEPLWNYSYESKVPYMSINVKEDVCYKCGFVGEHNPTKEGYMCPQCGNTDPTQQQVIRRISGYLSDFSSRQVNHSKKEEITNRVVHY